MSEVPLYGPKNNKNFMHFLHGGFTAKRTADCSSTARNAHPRPTSPFENVQTETPQAPPWWRPNLRTLSVACAYEGWSAEGARRRTCAGFHAIPECEMTCAHSGTGFSWTKQVSTLP